MNQSIHHPLQLIPEELKSAFTLNGCIPVVNWYFNDKGGQFLHLYTEQEMDRNIAKAKRGEVGYYGETDLFLYKALSAYPIKGKDVLLFGSAKPWYEAICFAYGCKSCTVLEYNLPDINYPNLYYHLPEELEGRTFDMALSISSFEHDGLGQYGDPIRPYQDIQAMQKAKSLLSSNGLLFLVLPIGRDLLVWNTHRIYGRVRLPLMLEGWEVVATSGMSMDKFDHDTRVGEFPTCVCFKSKFYPKY